MAPNADYRKQFLLKYYGELWASINRNLVTMWQSISIVIAAFAILGLVEKEVLTLSLAVCFMVLLIFWFTAHLIDAAFWFNRNLVIIENIERQFLTKQDLRNIQFYFGTHRRVNRMITYFKIQFFLGIGLLLVTILFHIGEIFFPAGFFQWSTVPFDYLPYVIIVIAACLILGHIRSRNDEYDRVLERSPGKEI